MDESRTDAKLEKIEAHLSRIDVTLAKNTVSLEEHIRRTEQIEKRLDGLPAKALTLLTLLSGFLVLAKQFLSLGS